jgi:hypothetical protein
MSKGKEKGGSSISSKLWDALKSNIDKTNYIILGKLLATTWILLREQKKLLTKHDDDYQREKRRILRGY